MGYEKGDKVLIEAVFDSDFNDRCIVQAAGQYYLAPCDNICPSPANGTAAMRKTYEDGLNDAWEAMRDIGKPDYDGGIPYGDLLEMFGTDSAEQILYGFDAGEAVGKIRAWEENKEIHVDDEVAFDNGKGVVFETDGAMCRILKANMTMAERSKTSVTKTGRVINISGLLAQIGAGDQ